ncbi:MAG: recombinase family protein [Endomicrobium sp.]|nr:recombinase family protein [Endomicrobium sp.]
MGNVKNAVIYVRVSTDEQAKGGESLDNQERKCTEWAGKNGFEIIRKPFREEGESGGTADRTQLKELLKFCQDKNNNVNAVICYKVDRLSRNVGDFAYLSKHLRKEGVQVLFTNGTNLDNALGRFILTLEAAIGELELGMITERILDGVRAALKNGRHLHRLLGYSFGVNQDNKKQTYPNADASKIEKIFNSLDDGYNQPEVIKIMRQEYGMKISPQTLDNIAKNPVYCGLLPDKHNVNNGQLIKGIHEPIISEELFFSVQKKLNSRSRNNKYRNYANPIFPLLDFVFCGEKEDRMTGSSSKGTFPYYHCQGNKCCRYRKKDVEEVYLGYLETLKLKDEHLEMFKQMTLDIYEQKTTHISKQNERLKKEIVELEGQQLDTLRLVRDNAEMKALGEKELKILADKIQEKKGYIMDEAKIDMITEECWDFVKFFMNNVAAIWETGNFEIKKDVQSLISPKGFVFRYGLIELKETPHFISSFGKKKPKTKSGGGGGN